jgi:hypothetical protein
VWFALFTCLWWSSQGVALVVKYTDNIHKGFCSSIAIVIASIINYFLFNDIEINFRFAFGSMLVVVSTLAFASLSNDAGMHGMTLPSSTVPLAANSVLLANSLLQGTNGEQHEVLRITEVETAKQF